MLNINAHIHMNAYPMVAIVRGNPIIYDARIIKKAQSLANAGFFVIILGWDRDLSHRIFERMNKRVVIFRFRLKAPYKKVILIFYYLAFWSWIFVQLAKIKPKIIHIESLVCAAPILAYKFIRFGKTRVIYDLRDAFQSILELTDAKILVPIKGVVNLMEKIAMLLSDVVITVSKEQADLFRWIFRKKPHAIIINAPQLSLYNKLFAKNICSENDKCRSFINQNKKYIVYAGPIVQHRGLLQIALAVKNLRNVEFLLLGKILDQNLFKQIMNCNNTRYLGVKPYEDAIRIQRYADIIAILYDPLILVNKIGSPNKLFEAMMMGKPILASRNTAIGSFITRYNLGYAVPYNDIYSIRKAIMTMLTDKKFIEDVNKRAKELFVKIFNWERMEKKLIKIHRILLSH